MLGLRMIVVVFLVAVLAGCGGAATKGSSDQRSGLIAFDSDRSGASQIYVMRPDGSGVRRLTSGGGEAPAWSPDGKRIAFVRDGGIFVMNADGSHLRKLTRSALGDGSPAWSPSGREIAFEMSSSTDFNNLDLAVMNADGSHVRYLYVGNVGDNCCPSWSPDGREYAYSGDGAVYTIRVDGGGLRKLVAGGAPAWSPDGKKVAFEGGPGSNFEIETINIDGSHRRNLTRNPLNDTHPAWSPDGQSIAFTRQTPDSTNREIWVMKADGSGQRPLTKADADNGDPVWVAKETRG